MTRELAMFMNSRRIPRKMFLYSNFHSNHRLQHKRAVVSTLLLRAQTLVSEEVDKVKEIQHVKQAKESQQLF